MFKKRYLKISSSLILLFNFSANAQSVYPEIAQKLPSLEVGKAVLILMPQQGTKYRDWAFLGNSREILWINDGYVTETWKSGETPTFRRGLMRIRVNNIKSTVLKKNLHELAWTVQYTAFGNPKHGFERITLSAGPPDQGCFGTLYEGCDFDPITSIKSAGISAIKICSNESAGGKIVGYKFSNPEKIPVLARIEYSYGSGGASTGIALDFLAIAENLCDFEKFDVGR